MFILRYGSFSMSFATLQATWNLMNWINIRSDGSKLVAHFYLPIFYKLRMKKILLEQFMINFFLKNHFRKLCFMCMKVMPTNWIVCLDNVKCGSTQLIHFRFIILHFHVCPFFLLQLSFKYKDFPIMNHHEKWITFESSLFLFVFVGIFKVWFTRCYKVCSLVCAMGKRFLEVLNRTCIEELGIKHFSIVFLWSF